MYPTLAELIRTLPRTGRYWIAVGGHAICYVDGVVFDNMWRTKTRARVNTCARVVLKPAPVALVPVPEAQMSQAQINELWARLDALEGKKS
jgi:hypothetical protein